MAILPLDDFVDKGFRLLIRFGAYALALIDYTYHKLFIGSIEQSQASKGQPQQCRHNRANHQRNCSLTSREIAQTPKVVVGDRGQHGQQDQEIPWARKLHWKTHVINLR